MNQVYHCISLSNGWENKGYDWSLQPIFRKLGGCDQQDWADYMGLAEFSCNVVMHLFKKCEQVFEITKLLVEKSKKQYKEQVNDRKHEMEYEVGRKRCC
jgi:hypothetical protein